MRPDIFLQTARPFLLCVLALFSATAHATIGLVVGEPFGSFGTMLPVGHASIYLDHLCADTPTHLRTCQPGELGVVISRYHDLRDANLDWMAIPASIFFYGVEDPSQAPQWVTHATEDSLRSAYRDAHLIPLTPDHLRHGRFAPRDGDWQEAIGAAFDRRLFLYTLDTTAAQDALLLDQLNASPNIRSYSLGRANCADFAASLISLVVPPVLRRNVLADFDMTTPKNLARVVHTFSHAHPELHPHAYQIPQIPGTLRRSRPLRGSAETFVKTKRYLFTVLVLQPELLLTDWIFYASRGRWTPGRDAQPLTPSQWPHTLVSASYSSASTSSSTASEAIGFVAK